MSIEFKKQRGVHGVMDDSAKNLETLKSRKDFFFGGEMIYVESEKAVYKAISY